jgi:transcriptional regulator with XRE-family HTH domain
MAVNNETVATINNDVGRRLAAARAGRNITQGELADALGSGWNDDTIGAIERGARRLGYAEAVAICAALDLSLTHLAAGTDAARQVRTQDAARAARAAAAVAGDEAVWTAIEAGPPPARPTARQRALEAWLADLPEHAALLAYDTDRGSFVKAPPATLDQVGG